MNSTAAYKIGDRVLTATAGGTYPATVIDTQPTGTTMLYKVRMDHNSSEYWKYLSDLQPYVTSPLEHVWEIPKPTLEDPIDLCSKHSWREYIGFTDRFWYCDYCDERWDGPEDAQGPVDGCEDLPW